MKILSVSDIVVSDLVGTTSPIEADSIDLILGCGDLPPEYLARLRAKYDVPLYYILGNHDIRHQLVPQGCLNITGRIVHHGSFSFLGFSGSRWYNGNPNQFREREMRAQIRKLWFPLWRLKRLDVLVTHAPPRHVHDAEDRCHRGFSCYREFIRRHKPRFMIHGHIHRFFKTPAERLSVVNGTKVMNSYGYHVFEI
ncbi:MAG: Icc-like protein [Desulfofustis sp.]|nr:metallophosphoesterase family protein [Desulfofustis sp.]NNK14797.1 Icc-like protein [Desulfofustis sp.]